MSTSLTSTPVGHGFVPDHSAELKQSLAEIEHRSVREYEEKKKEPLSNLDKSLSDIVVEQRWSEQSLRWQIVEFRKYLLRFLVYFMTIENVVLYVIVVVASLPIGWLKINDTTLQILVGATIAQISTMLIVIVRSVYSDSLNRVILSDESGRK